MQASFRPAAPEPFPETILSRIDAFAGRSWLLSPLLDWLENSQERLFLITGEPGSGKSMVAAWLAGYGPAPDDPDAREKLETLRRAIKGVHFCIATTGSVSPKACAENLARQLFQRVEGFAAAHIAKASGKAQLSVEQQVGQVLPGGSVIGYWVEALNLGSLNDEAAFDRALRAPLIDLYRQGYNEPLVLLFDALDESLARSGGGEISIARLLSRLDDLPRQVRILATTRHDERALAYHRRARRIDLIRDQPESAGDLRGYVERQLAASETAQAERLAERILQAAEGNFLYAHLVLADLRSRPGAWAEHFEQTLPRDLSDIYHRFLLRERDEDEERWYRYLRPVLGLLAVAQGQGLTAAQLETITGQEVEQTLRLCKQYLEGELPHGPFRPFHRSFVQFLLEDEDNIDFHIDAARMHRQMADWIWQAQSNGWQSCGDYGLNHLSLHLYESGDLERLGALVREDWIRARYAQGRASFQGLLEDIDLIWRAVEEANEAQLEARRLAPHLADEVRCALAHASINSIAGRTAPGFVLGLVQEGVWSGEQGLGYARSLSDPAARHRALLLLLPALPPALQESAVQDALAAAGQIARAAEQAIALAALLPALPAEERRAAFVQAMEALGGLQDSEEYDPNPSAPSFYGHPKPLQTRYTGERSRALQVVCMLINRFTEPPTEAGLSARLAAAWEQEDEAVRAQMLDELAEAFVALPVGVQALITTGERETGAAPDPAGVSGAAAGKPPLIRDEEAIAAVFDQLTGVRQPGGLEGEQAARTEEPVEQAFRRLLAIESETTRARALADILPQLPDALLSEALAAVCELKPHWIATLLGVLAPRLPEALLPQALAAVRAFDLPPWQRARVDALLALAPRLPSEALHEATQLTLDAGDKRDIAANAQVRMLVALAPVLPEALLPQVFDLAGSLPRVPRKQVYLAFVDRIPESRLQEALELLRSLEDERERAVGLAALARRMPDALQSAVLEAVLRIRDETARADALVDLLPQMPDGLLSSVLDAAVNLTASWLRARIFTALAPRLDAALQSRLLDAIRKEDPETTWASLLVQVFPHLDRERLLEAWEMARQLKTPKSCADVLVPIAAGLSPDEPLKARLVADAFASANAIVSPTLGWYSPDPYQATALLRLLPHLPGEQQAQALEKIREVIERTQWSWWGLGLYRLPTDPDSEPLAPELVALLPDELKEKVYDRAIEAALDQTGGRGYRHWIASAQIRALIPLLSHLPEARWDAVVSQIFQIMKDDLIDYCGYNCYQSYLRIEDMQALAPYLSAELLAAAEALDTENALPDAIPERLLDAMLEAARSHKNARWLFGIAPRLDTAQLVAAVSAAGEIGGAALQAEFVATFVGELARIPASELYPAWRGTLHAMAALNRSEFLQHFGSFAPLITALAGEERLPDVAAAVREAGQWWP